MSGMRRRKRILCEVRLTSRAISSVGARRVDHFFEKESQKPPNLACRLFRYSLLHSYASLCIILFIGSNTNRLYFNMSLALWHASCNPSMPFSFVGKIHLNLVLPNVLSM